ncbi:MAG: hypothetical protein AAGC93_05420 [Cyanobacteria bacterium P01_F01_bin.53]
MTVRVPKFAVKAKDIITKENPTFVKKRPFEDPSSSDFKLSREDLPLLVTRIDRDLKDVIDSRRGGGETFEREHGHWEIELAVPIDGKFNWFLFHKHVEEVPLPEFFIQGREDLPTVIKHSLDGNLSPEDRFNFNEYEQPLQAKWIEPAGDSKHIKFELLKPVNGKFTWYAFSEHVVPSKVRSTVNV